MVHIAIPPANSKQEKVTPIQEIILYTCICGYESYTITNRYVDTVHCCYTDTESSNQLFIQMVVAVHHRCCYFLPFLEKLFCGEARM